MTAQPFVRITQRGRYFVLEVDSHKTGSRITLKMHNHLRNLAEVAIETSGAPEYAKGLYFTPSGGQVKGLEFDDAQRLAGQITAYLTKDKEGAA